MSDISPIPEFGSREADQRYVPRPGVYAMILDDQSRVAILQTPRGCYLPGGGAEDGETPEETLVREVREECGFSIHSVRRVGEAVEYVYTVGNDTGIRKECVFFEATVIALDGSPIEMDHTLLWLKPEDAQVRLAHGSQRWAVGEFLALQASRSRHGHRDSRDGG